MCKEEKGAAGLFKAVVGGILIAIPTPITTPLGLATVASGVNDMAEDIKENCDES